MTQWLKTLTASLCILTILLHLIPQGKFTKYVRFYAGLLFFLIAAAPALEIFTGEGELERLLRLEFLKEEYYDLETAVSGMEDLKNDQIKTAYQQELHRQVEELAEAYGLQVKSTGLSFDAEDGFTLKGVSVTLEPGTYDSGRIETLKSEIAGVYLIGLNRVTVSQE